MLTDELSIAALQYLFDTLYGAATLFLFSGVPATRRNVLTMALTASLAYAFVFVAIFTHGLEGLGIVYTLGVHLPFVLTVAIGLKRPLRITLMAFFFSYFTLTPRLLLGGLAMLVAECLEPGMDPAIAQRIGWALTGPLLFWPVHRFLVRPLRGLIDQSGAERGILPALSAFAFLVIKGMSVLETTAGPWMPMLRATLYSTFIILFMTSFVLYAHKLKEENETKARLIVHERQSEGLAMYAESLRGFLEETAKLRHDHRHILAILSIRAAHGDIGGIRRLVGDQLAALDANPAGKTGSSVTDGLMALFGKRAEDRGVAIELRGLGLSELPIPEDDLCLLLSNGLDNAIAAAGSVEGRERRVTISVSRSSETGAVAIEVSNPYSRPPSFDRDGIPTSSRGPEHGYGSRSMQSIVRKHGGVCAFSERNGYFVFRAAFFSRPRASDGGTP